MADNEQDCQSAEHAYKTSPRGKLGHTKGV